MSYVTTGLTSYVKEEGMPLIIKAVCQGKTAQMVNIISGLKGSAKVPFLTNDVVLADGATCDPSDASSTTFTQVPVTVAQVAYYEALCNPSALENKSLIYSVTNPFAENVPFEADFMNSKTLGIQNAIEKLLWVGDSGSGDVIDGFPVTADDNSLLIEVTGVTGSTYELVDGLITGAITADCTWEDSDTAAVFMSYANFRLYIQALVEKNLFWYNPEAIKAGTEAVYHPGTKIKIVATSGLAGKSELYLADTKHLHIGTNLLDESEAMVVFYDKAKRVLTLRADFFLGCGISKELYWLD